MKIFWGGCCQIIGGDTSLHEFALIFMKRFEITEKLYLSKALLKMAGEGVHPPHPPLDLPLALGMLLNVCLLVLRLLFFEKFAGSPHGQQHKYGMEAPHRANQDKNILNLRIGLFTAPLSYVD